MKEKIRTYYVKFMVDTIHTEAKIKAYSKTEVESLLKKQYVNCKITVDKDNDIEDITERKNEETEEKEEKENETE